MNTHAMTLDPLKWLCRQGGPLPDPGDGSQPCDLAEDAPVELPEDGEEPIVN